ncbi:MAG: NHL repeat-containing protein [Pirellulales bacterium]|nr:NHL repeat-containing protein [Pirellulales bacterium]
MRSKHAHVATFCKVDTEAQQDQQRRCRRLPSLRLTHAHGHVLPALLLFSILPTLIGMALTVPAAHGQDAPSEGFRYPLSVAAASDGTLYVADRMLPGVWKVTNGEAVVFAQGQKKFRTPLNAIRTVALAADGTLYVGDSATREVYRLGEDGTATPLTDGAIGIPVDIAVNSTGELFVSDLETQRIWKLPASASTTSEPIAAEEVAQLAAPRGLFVDAEDRLWAIAASGEAPLVRIGADGMIEPVVTTRAFEFPHDVVVDEAGIAFVSDNYARCIWQVSLAGEVSKVASGEPLSGPVGLAQGAGGVLIADPRTNAILQLDSSGMLTAIAPAKNAGE